jgi:hypothetical protein
MAREVRVDREDLTWSGQMAQSRKPRLRDAEPGLLND